MPEKNKPDDKVKIDLNLFNIYETDTGDKVFISKGASVGHLQIGRYSYINAGTQLSGAHLIRIGAFTSIAMNVYCWTSENHQTKYVTTYPLNTWFGIDIGYSELVDLNCEVTIGNDVWIGRGVRILPGVTIADGCVVGAQAVVAKSLTEPYGIYVGVPARLVKKRCSPETADKLLQIRWWDWPLEKIRRNALFFNIDISTYTGNFHEVIVD